MPPGSPMSISSSVHDPTATSTSIAIPVPIRMEVGRRVTIAGILPERERSLAPGPLLRLKGRWAYPRRTMCERARSLIIALAAATGACGDGGEAEMATDSEAEMPFVQPGLDDPTARQMTKAGSWYPEDHEELDADVMSLVDAIGASEVRPAFAMLTPHASLKFSGPTAAEAFARVQIPDRVIVLAPDHWGEGAPAAIWNEGPWLVPGHAIAIDQELVAEVWEALP